MVHLINYNNKYDDKLGAYYEIYWRKKSFT